MGRPPGAMTLYEQIKQRQIGLCGKGQRASFITTRDAYSELVPNYTIYKVQVPLHNIILRFTPDGRYLVCMSSISNMIYLYYLKTCIYPWSANNPATSTEDERLCFPLYFDLKYKQLIKTSPGHHLCKDFCLVLSNRKYMILASSSSTNEPTYPRNLGAIDDRNDYTFYSIEVESGKSISRYTISSDFLRLNRNACVSVLGQMLAILSLKTQSIKLVLVDVHGSLHELRSIGQFLCSSDQLTVDLHEQRNINGKRQKESLHYPRPRKARRDHDRFPQLGNNNFVRASLLDRIWSDTTDEITTDDDNIYWDDAGDENYNPRTALHGSFQQAFLSKLFRSYQKINDGGNAMRQFYRNFDVYANLKFWEIQFLDEKKLLIKMLPGNTSVNSNRVGTTNPLVVFVVFNIQTSQIDEIFDQANERVVHLFNDYANTILGTPPDGMIWLGSNCIHQSQFSHKSILHGHSHSWSCGNRGSRTDAIRRLATELPIISQSYMDCPYFDQSLFTCDERLVSPITSTPRSANEAIKFYSSITKQLKFKINPNPSCNERQVSPNITQQQPVMIPHPKYPFIITKQLSIYNSPTINFHVYKSPTSP
ncbi:De-etiolated protein 1 Det1-domain-containing protein [Absidia repens]|uniref:De-etiolated protein 1 Det1-domain-containing protein n=1 Tax=Absidia repens TaxID=90262 RepID=A0A1X2I2D3_9FUNG|nr:De-etiolated protein 1 Det1-domain-containing protein [Absidia repens]